MEALGIDIGGTGIKGAKVDLATGELTTDRFRLPTPQPATPEAVLATIDGILQHFEWEGVVGIGFPGIVNQGVIRKAANMDPAFVGVNVAELVSNHTGYPCIAVNDADAAGMAEMKWGAGKGFKGSVLMVTIGTGLGTALFSEGVMYPNAEFGHIYLNGIIAEHYASNRTRETLGLSWEEWGLRFNEYLLRMYELTSPELIILGGGTSKKLEKFSAQLSVPVPVKAAEMRNQAGIIGAAASFLD